MSDLKFVYLPIKFQQQFLHKGLVPWFYVQFVLPLQLKGTTLLCLSCLVSFLPRVSTGAHVAVQ